MTSSNPASKLRQKVIVEQMYTCAKAQISDSEGREGGVGVTEGEKEERGK